MHHSIFASSKLPLCVRLAAFSSLAAPNVSLLVPKLLYVLLNLIGVGVVGYKLRNMGLLPVTSADWVSLLPLRHPAEWSSRAMPLE